MFLRWLAVLLLVPATPVAPSSIEDYLREQQAELRIPGLAYAVVGPGGRTQQAGWGVDGDGAPVTTRTPFLLGSVSKPVTALAVMRLVEAGRIGLDDPVQRHVPWFRLADEEAAARITVRQLLNHTSGLRQWASRTDRFDNGADGLARSVRDLATVEPASGGVHEYSDANYMVLGALVETVTGQPFGVALRSEVFEPLGMPDASATEGAAAGHRYWFGRPVRFDPGHDTSGAPYGYVSATTDDLVPFVTAQLDGSPILSPEGFAQMHTGGPSNYGLGWRDTTQDGSRLIWHAGATPGYFAHVILVPGADLGVVILANSYSLGLDGRLADIGFTVARMAQGLPGESPAVAADPVLGVTPYAMVGLAGLLLAGVAWSIVRLVRPRRRPRLATTVAWVAGCAVLAAVVLVALPALLGGDFGMALLWVPDVGWGMVAVAVSAGVLAVARVGLLARTRERSAG